MTVRCAPTTNAFPMQANPGRWCGALAAVLFCAATACDAEPGAASTNAAEPMGNVATYAADPAQQVAPAPGATGLKLGGRADAAAATAALAEAKRQKMTGVEVTAAQSFNVMDGTREVATVLTGKGMMPGATYAGCFVAVQQGRDIELIPTLGYGNYEAETCGGPLAIGILSSSDTVRFGIIFGGYSREAETRVPIVVEWTRADNTLLIDDGLSTKALDSGATTIPAIRRLIAKP